MKIDNEFELGESVYIKNDPDQKEWIVVKLNIYVDGSITYGLVCAGSNINAFAVEISRDKSYNT